MHELEASTLDNTEPTENATTPADNPVRSGKEDAGAEGGIKLTLPESLKIEEGTVK
jgi:hypothetical protein